MKRQKLKTKKEGKIVVISAPSGAGKSTVVKQLMKRMPRLKRSISYTTRPPRNGEMDKRDYFFTTPSEFKKKIKSGFFVEYARVHGRYYGTSYSFINEVIKKGSVLLLVIDTQGAFQIRKKYPHNSILVFLLPPSLEEMEKRLRKRGTETTKSIARRLRNAKKEIQKIRCYDYVVVNDRIEKAVKKIESIIIGGGKIGKSFIGRVI